MKIGIVGGALQGMEAVYLSQKAGYASLVVDRKEKAPARSLSDESVTVDVVKEPEAAKRILSDCDAVIPACEELDALHSLDKMLKGMEIPFLFDMRSYSLSCSKERSNAVMAEQNVPLPRPWPDCGFPVIVKPSSQSGSIGVSEVNDESEMGAALEKVAALNDVPIIQEFVSGKSVSIEVVGNGTNARSYVTTEVVLDANYDCKRVICEPGILSEADEVEFGRIGVDVAEAIGLNALMDVEAIYTKNGLRVLEIDARIPSQTPATILAGTGINLFDELLHAKIGKETGNRPSKGASSYEHFAIDGSRMITCGEKVFGHVSSPRIVKGLFGSDEMITDYEPGKKVWYATMITSGSDPAEVRLKREAAIASIIRDCGITEFIDRSPEMV